MLYVLNEVCRLIVLINLFFVLYWFFVIYVRFGDLLCWSLWICVVACLIGWLCLWYLVGSGFLLSVLVAVGSISWRLFCCSCSLRVVLFCVWCYVGYLVFGYGGCLGFNLLFIVLACFGFYCVGICGNLFWDLLYFLFMV